MKQCTSCNKSLPDSAAHCVFCGTKLAAPIASTGAKTLMGYQGGDLLKDLKASVGRGTPEPGPGGTPARAGAASPVPTAPPGAPTLNVIATPQPSSPDPAISPVGTAQVQPSPGPAAALPLPRATPPTTHAAAGSAARDASPDRSTATTDSLRRVLIVFGALLVAGFLTPVDPRPTFHWEFLANGLVDQIVLALQLVLGGALALIAGLAPASTGIRSTVAALVGLSPFAILLAMSPPGEWQPITIMVAALAVPTGLMLRHAHRHSSLARTLTTVGALGVIAVYLAPAPNVPLLVLVNTLSDASSPANIEAGVLLVPFLLALASLLVWLPPSSSAGAKALAWIIILFPMITQLTMVIARGHIGEAVEAQPFDTLLAWVPISAGIAMFSHGAARWLGESGK